ncbi:hypothetical protein [Daejeonella sp.]|uniref:kelch repeat-containing protein n=1 Tax=Daejeonella sp. TaxID=2805397 RepID=UPI0025C0C012|nr:hypothetical protein [Daejeonella sp.]
MNYYGGIFLIAIVFFGASFSFAQEQYFEWVNPKTTLRERIDIRDYTHTKEDSSGNWVTGDLIKTSIASPIGQKIDSDENNYFNLKDGNQVLFTRSGTQNVFIYDTKLKSLSRLDKTSYGGYNFFATQFIRKDTLYSAGGYGFWNFHNKLTYFDKSMGEWEMIRTSGTGPKTIVKGYQGYEAEEDVFYSGASEDEAREVSIDKFFYPSFFKYDFKTSTWEELGEINSKLPYKTNRDIFWTGKYFLQADQDKLFIIDPSANSVFYYSDIKQILLRGNHIFIKGDSVFVYWDSKKNIQKFSISDVLSKSKRIGDFYSKPSYVLYSGISLILLLILTSIYFNWKKVRRWRVQVILDQQELVLFEALLKLDAGSYLNGNEVNDLLDLYGKSLESQRKVRMNVINQLNLKIKQKFNINDAVQRIDDPSDKRYRLYFLNPRFLSMLKKSR